MDAFTTQSIHSDDFFDTYVNPHSLDQILGDMCTSMPSIGSLPTMQPVTTHRCRAGSTTTPFCSRAAASHGRLLTSSTIRASVGGQKPQAATHPNTRRIQPPRRPMRSCHLSLQAFCCSMASRFERRRVMEDS
ncbi:unnamed protein product [Prorocentrum cordatum]|uniref:Uncharacterized protein n=1 Tax=Prorocentrum cordatum TaxID=2364126 RepID=A0ABN9SEZ2_9DINO|nr:unnamed protein product [Polarella glacialis]